MREHGEETEIMRDLGKEDVRAYSSEKGKELVMEKGKKQRAERREEHLKVKFMKQSCLTGREWA